MPPDKNLPFVNCQVYLENDKLTYQQQHKQQPQMLLIIHVNALKLPTIERNVTLHKKINQQQCA